MLDKLFIFVQPFSIRALTYYSVSTHCKYGSGLLVRKVQVAIKLLLPPTSPHLHSWLHLGCRRSRLTPNSKKKHFEFQLSASRFALRSVFSRADWIFFNNWLLMLTELRRIHTTIALSKELSFRGWIEDYSSPMAHAQCTPPIKMPSHGESRE